MFHVQGSFEQSLRGGDEVSPSGNKTLAALAKIHKHCTGKAHALGCADHKHNPLAKSDSNTSLQSRKSFRTECIIEIQDDKNLNSIKNNDGSYTKSFSNSTSSYEGHSDTDSENALKNRMDSKITDPCERLFSQNTKASLMKTARMRYADDSVISSMHDEVDGDKSKPFCRTPLRGSYRERKSTVVTIDEVKSDGSNNEEDLANAVLFDEKRKTPTQNKIGIQRKNSPAAVVNGKNAVNGTKPPWRGASKNSIPVEPFVRQPSLRGSIKKKTVKSDGIPWKRLYELSLWRKFGVSFAAVGADTERALLRPWSELSSQPQPPLSAKSEEQLACEKEWLKAGHMWLAHRGGFTAVVREGDADAGRARVRVLQTGEVLTVDEDDLEKANPPQMERCEDIASLRCLNECGALNVLRSRHAAGLPHARAGHALLVLGPPKRSSPIYTEKVAAMFRGCRADDMPPHIFAAAQSAHRCMLASRRDRAIVFTGRSGSGKTLAMRHCIWYLASAYPAQGSKLTPERLSAAMDVLHMFGSCRTGSNPHASRVVSLVSLDFEGGGALVSASVQTLLPDLRPGRSRLTALHTLFHGCDGRLRRELLFDQAPVNAPNPFLTSSEKADAPSDFSALKEAFQLLGVTEQEQMAVWKILAAICHLGWAGVVKANSGSGMKYQFSNAGLAARALGVAAEELARAVFAAAGPASPQPNNNLRTPSPSTEREISGTEALDAFVTGLYNETFNIIAALVNRSISTSARTSASLLLLDAPGADNPMSSGHQSGAPLSKLLSNYLQERLQAVFHDAMLVAPRERYAQEGITLDDGAEEDWLSETVNPGPMVELLDKSPQNSIVRSSQADLRECDRRGLLWLLDEESMYPGSSDDTFLERVMTHYGPPNQTQYLIKKAPHARQFVLQHLQGTNPVLYDVTGWVKASRENPVTKKALTLLQESQTEEIGRLSGWARGLCG